MTFVLSVILSIIISVFTASESIKAGIKEQGYQDYGEHTLTLLDINTKQDFTLKNIKTEKVGEYQIVRFGMSTQN
jgi:putative ABC transport system permease protein